MQGDNIWGSALLSRVYHVTKREMSNHSRTCIFIYSLVAVDRRSCKMRPLSITRLTICCSEQCLAGLDGQPVLLYEYVAGALNLHTNVDIPYMNWIQPRST